ncbi:MAG: aldo/keto reductase [Chloroflexota bacterium]|nr:MAG: aldo/keto reductase [Chloroflexota bacterium]
MKYRKFGQLDWECSTLGFGCMRFPTIDGDSAKIDEAESANMLHYAIDHGVNYIDTAYPYHQKQSEPFVGRTLKGKYREKVKLATKLPCWEVETANDFDRLLNEQLERLQTEQIDFYLLHALNKKSWDKVHGLDVLPWAEKAIADGRIAHLGFSFHDDYPVFEEIIDAYDHWDFCQIQYNYMDTNVQAGRKGLHYAASKGLAVVIMEPIRGGRLVSPPAPVQTLWDTAPHQRTPADWALQWVWNQPEVTLLLSGMSTMQHVIENVASADASGVGTMTEDELAVIQKVREKYQELIAIPCTQCEYCLPCPEGVNIPRVFDVYNDGIMYDKLDHAKFMYNNFVPETERANLCVACRECEEKCPQNILISEWMPRVHAALSE